MQRLSPVVRQQRQLSRCIACIGLSAGFPKRYCWSTASSGVSRMPSRFAGIAVRAMLALAAPICAIAGPYEDGDAAFHRKEYAVAFGLWQPLAEGGDARAQIGIAEMYLNGLGTPPDHEVGLWWCKKAADQGEPYAQYVLGSMYRDGRGVQKNIIRALALFRNAADQDLHWAQYNLGLMYFAGEGIPPDYPEAYYWLGIAAVARENDNGQVYSTASFLLREVEAKLTPDEIEEAKQRIRRWKPARPH
jgi:TPR repeat protein